MVSNFASLPWTIKQHVFVLLTLTYLYIFKTDDLDLHVLTPGGDHIWNGNTFDSVSNGRLDHDDIPKGAGLYVENVYFPLDGTAPAGTYTYLVRNFKQGGVAPDAWKIEVHMGDKLIAQNFGTTATRTYSDLYTVDYDGPSWCWDNLGDKRKSFWRKRRMRMAMATSTYEYLRRWAVEIVEGIESQGVNRFHSNGRLGRSNAVKHFQRLEHKFLFLVDRRHDNIQ
jgi:hypothetical protein